MISIFSYYGSKSRCVHLYPEPKHDAIIEPFAGSARYSLRYFERDVRLYDLSPYVVEVWRYLIAASINDVLSLPVPPDKTSLDDYSSLSDAERWLIGFHLCRGKARPRKVGHGQNQWASDKVRIARNLFKVRHWKIEQGSYTEIPNQIATWFYDPPYRTVQNRRGNSDRYPFWAVDYQDLAWFAKTRLGQVIVCEGAKEDYLPFTLLATVNANTNNDSVKKIEEHIYVTEN